jgi:hypothetical protein
MIEGMQRWNTENLAAVDLLALPGQKGCVHSTFAAML